MTDELDEIVRKYNRYNKGKGGFDELEMKQAILALCNKARLELMNLYGTPICENLHHSKKYRHSASEPCPVEDQIAELQENMK